MGPPCAEPNCLRSTERLSAPSRGSVKGLARRQVFQACAPSFNLWMCSELGIASQSWWGACSLPSPKIGCARQERNLATRQLEVSSFLPDLPHTHSVLETCTENR